KAVGARRRSERSCLTRSPDRGVNAHRSYRSAGALGGSSSEVLRSSRDQRSTSMTTRVLYRIAAVVFLLFAAGHTFGFLSFRPESADALAVYNSMNSVTFDFNGTVRSYAQFYTGFGLQVTAYLVFGAYLAWHLGKLAASHPKAIGALA